MANIALSAKVSREDSALKGLSRLSVFLWKQAWKHADGAAAGDIEAVHDMRVALRRLRSTLQSFEGEKTSPVISAAMRREIRQQRRELERVGDALGAVRDFDVLGEYLEKYSRERLRTQSISETEHPGLCRFQRYLHEKRAIAVAPLIKRLNKARRQGALQETFARWALGLPAAWSPPLELTTVARQLLQNDLAKVLSLQNALEAHDEEAQHELRKALRRLRYTLEALGTALNATPEQIAVVVKTLVALQDLLGEMQDRTVLRAAVLNCFGIQEAADKSTSAVAREREILRQVPPDIAMFLRFGSSRRRRLLAQVRKLWKSKMDEDFLGAIRDW